MPYSMVKSLPLFSILVYASYRFVTFHQILYFFSQKQLFQFYDFFLVR
jgi:hypothetical protein